MLKQESCRPCVEEECSRKNEIACAKALEPEKAE